MTKLGICRAYIQSSRANGFPFNDTAFAIYSACEQMGISVILSPTQGVLSLESATPDSIFVWGGIPFTKGAMGILGISVPEFSDYPSELEWFRGRNIDQTTIGCIRQRGSSYPLFIKPFGGEKQFNGFVHRGTIEDLIRINTLDDELKVWSSDAVLFTSEYRVMVHHGSIISCRHYKGDCTVFPDMKRVLRAVRDYSSCPIGYALDVGVTYSGETLLVEVNDGWALGSYGTPPLFYAPMVIDRWKEIAYGASKQ